MKKPRIEFKHPRLIENMLYFKQIAPNYNIRIISKSVDPNEGFEASRVQGVQWNDERFQVVKV